MLSDRSETSCHGQLQEEAEKERDLEREKTGSQLFLRSLTVSESVRFFLHEFCRHVMSCVSFGLEATSHDPVKAFRTEGG